MAMLKSLNKIGSAPPAPGPLPDTALILVEINGQVYKVAASALAGGEVELPGWVENMPTSDPEVAGQVYAAGDTLMVSEGGGGD